jgi:hypothetical protein
VVGLSALEVLRLLSHNFTRHVSEYYLGTYARISGLYLKVCLIFCTDRAGAEAQRLAQGLQREERQERWRSLQGGPSQATALPGKGGNKG